MILLLLEDLNLPQEVDKQQQQKKWESSRRMGQFTYPWHHRGFFFERRKGSGYGGDLL